MNHKTKKILPYIAYFTSLNIVISSFYGFKYLSFYGHEIHTPLSLFFGVTSWISQVGLISGIIACLLVLVSIVSKASRILQLIIAPFLFNLLNVYFYVDSRIYEMYRFHINGLVFSLMEAPLGRKTFKLHDQEYWTFLLLVIFLQSVLTFISFNLLFRSDRTEYRQIKVFKTKLSLTLKIAKRALVNKIVLATILMCTLLSHVIYATCDALNLTHVTFIGQAIPLYKPLTIKKFLAKNFNYQTPHTTQVQIPIENTLNYPSPKIDISKHMNKNNALKKKPNVIVIVLDSWRYDAMNEQASPHIWQHSKNSLRFNKHFSGGNNTRSGMFSLFYGIHGFYWLKFLQERRSPFLLDFFLDKGYKIKPYGSVSLAFPEFYQTIFSKVRSDIEDNFGGKTQFERDRQMTDAFVDFLQKNPKDQPFFASLLYDATHSPYESPENFRKFQPADREIYYAARQDVDGIIQVRNRYLNAVSFVDSQVARILEKVSNDRELKDNTYIIITSDHGEEFYDRGFFGHISAFTPEQTQVPMIMSGPNLEPQDISKLSSHYDIAPTFVSLLAPSIESKSYSFGHSLLAPNKRNHIVSCGWENCAIYDQDKWLIFGVEDYNMSKIELRDKDYNIVNRAYEDSSAIYTKLAKILDEGVYFLR